MFNNEDKRKILVYCTVTTITVITYLVLSNFTALSATLLSKLTVISPIIIGFVIAYILNIPLKLIENNYLSKLKISKHSRRALAIFFTLIIIIFMLIGIFSFVLPQLAASVDSLAKNVPDYAVSVRIYFEDLISKYDTNQEISQRIAGIWEEILKTASDILGVIISSLYDWVSNLLSGVINTIISLIIAIYMLLSKEKLIRMMKKLSRAYLPDSFANRLRYVLTITNRSFTGFIRGQVTEAFIIGILCFLGMTIFRFKFALLISVLIGITNIIPIFGPFIGAIPSALILFTVSPMRALWFVIFIIVLQQFEGNIIYPKVVGTSIGLSGFWVLIAVIIGSNLYGIMGIIIGIPLFATLYTLIVDLTNKRLRDSKHKKPQN